MKNIKIKVKKNEDKVFPFIWIDGDEQEVSIDAQLVGEGAKLTIVGIFLGKADSSITFNTNVVHAAPYTKSLTTLRGVFFNKSFISNDGLIRINKGAKGADGYFASKILLFDNAKGRSVPSLEIDENDLKAGHASTVGRPDENQMFYLRSRGLNEKEAQKLIVSGFFDPVLTLLPHGQKDKLKKSIDSIIT